MEMDLFNKTDTTLVYIASTEFTKEITNGKNLHNFETLFSLAISLTSLATTSY